MTSCTDCRREKRVISEVLKRGGVVDKVLVGQVLSKAACAEHR